MSDAKPSPLTAALEAFEAAETNLISLEHLWIEIERLIPSGVRIPPSSYASNRYPTSVAKFPAKSMISSNIARGWLDAIL